MVRIIDERGKGKTSRLLLLAKEFNGILVSPNKNVTQDIANKYGWSKKDIEIISYEDFINNKYTKGKIILIDEIDIFLKRINQNIAGYSLSMDEE